MAKSQAVSYYTNIINNIKSLDGYSPMLPVAFVGKDSNDETVYNIDWYSGDIRGTMTLNRFINMYSRHDFLRDYCGYAPYWYPDEKELINNYEIRDMPCYPNNGSIAIVNNVLVVKIANK